TTNPSSAHLPNFNANKTTRKNTSLSAHFLPSQAAQTETMSQTKVVYVLPAELHIYLPHQPRLLATTLPPSPIDLPSSPLLPTTDRPFATYLELDLTFTGSPRRTLGGYRRRRSSTGWRTMSHRGRTSRGR